MKFSENRPVKIVMLGAGGTGGHIAPHLYRLLYALERPVRFIICDGDIVEEKNLVRQNFTPADLGENKAKVLAERYSSVFGMETEYVPEFIESGERLLSMLQARTFPTGPYWHSPTVKELVILIGAVDNNKSRKLCHEVFYKLDDLIYIDSGNGMHTGQIVCGIRSGGRTFYRPVGAAFPEVLQDTDKFPTELSCAEASVSAPQSIAANITAATAVVDMIYNILTVGETRVRQITFATGSVNMRATLQKSRKKATIENILVDTNGNYIIIDPSPMYNNIFAEYSKLFQSLHGKYEYLKNSNSWSIEKNSIKYADYSTQKYSDIFNYIKQFIVDNYGNEGLKATYFYEAVCHLRTLSYMVRLNKNNSVLMLALSGLALNEWSKL